MSAKKAGEPPAPVQARTGRSSPAPRVDQGGRAEDRVGVVPTREPAVHLRGADQADGVAGEDQVEGVRREPVVLHEQRRGRRHISEDHPQRQADRGGVAHEPRVHDHPGVAPGQLGGGIPGPPPGRVGLGQVEPDRQAAEAGEAGERPEDQPPAAQAHQPPAHRRRDDRRDADDEHEHRVDPRRVRLLEAVADDRPRDDHPGGAGQAHDEPGEDQGLDRSGVGTGHAGDRERGRADEERTATADAVGDRAADELPHRQARQEQRQGQLHRPPLGPEVALDPGEGRQVHVDPEGAEGVEQAEQEDEAEGGPDSLAGRERPWFFGEHRVGLESRRAGGRDRRVGRERVGSIVGPRAMARPPRAKRGPARAPGRRAGACVPEAPRKALRRPEFRTSRGGASLASKMIDGRWSMGDQGGQEVNPAQTGSEI